MMMNKFILTMQYNESFFLPIFLRHYSQYFDPKNIFVIDHGSDQNLIPPEFNRIYIPRDKPFSELERLDFIKGICTGLMRYYDVGIFADTDELIYLNDFNYEALKDSSPLHVAGFDCTVLEIDGKKKLIGIPVPFLCKAMIFNKTPDWSIGFHAVVNLELPEFFYIPMAHLKYLSESECHIRNISRASTYEKMNAFEKGHGIDLHWRDHREDHLNFNKVIADSIKKNAINTFTPIKSEPLFTMNSLKDFIGNQPSDFIYQPIDCIWDPSRITDLTTFFPQIIEHY